MSEYINNTKDDIDGEQILQFLAKALPPENPGTTKSAIKVESGTTLTEATTALSVSTDPPIPSNNEVAASGQLDPAGVTAIINAAAIRIAANKYNLLKEMVKQGILRIVVESGKISTRFLKWPQTIS